MGIGTEVFLNALVSRSVLKDSCLTGESDANSITKSLHPAGHFAWFFHWDTQLGCLSSSWAGSLGTWAGIWLALAEQL